MLTVNVCCIGRIRTPFCNHHSVRSQYLLVVCDRGSRTFYARKVSAYSPASIHRSTYTLHRISPTRALTETGPGKLTRYAYKSQHNTHNPLWHSRGHTHYPTSVSRRQPIQKSAHTHLHLGQYRSISQGEGGHTFYNTHQPGPVVNYSRSRVLIHYTSDQSRISKHRTELLTPSY